MDLLIVRVSFAPFVDGVFVLGVVDVVVVVVVAISVVVAVVADLAALLSVFFILDFLLPLQLGLLCCSCSMCPANAGERRAKVDLFSKWY